MAKEAKEGEAELAFSRPYKAVRVLQLAMLFDASSLSLAPLFLSARRKCSLHKTSGPRIRDWPAHSATKCASSNYREEVVSPCGRVPLLQRGCMIR